MIGSVGPKDPARWGDVTKAPSRIPRSATSLSGVSPNEVRQDGPETPGFEVPWPPGPRTLFVYGLLGGLFVTFWIGVVVLMATETPSNAAQQPQAGETVASSPADTEDLVVRGEAVATSNGCLACHSIDGSSAAGPTWKGLWGRQVLLTDGRTVVADEDYLLKSIIDPAADIVDGYQPIMPTEIGERLSDEDLAALLAFIRSIP